VLRRPKDGADSGQGQGRESDCLNNESTRLTFLWSLVHLTSAQRRDASLGRQERSEVAQCAIEVSDESQVIFVERDAVDEQSSVGLDVGWLS
jgi:hypothetical protein